jgi:hypothetical protein
MDRRASLGINSISSLKRKYVESAEPTNADMTKLVPSDQEADLLSAIFELGLKNASPKVRNKLSTLCYPTNYLFVFAIVRFY